MLNARNQRVYLVLDPDEAEAIERQLQKVSFGPKIEKILARLRAAMERAREKGAHFGSSRQSDQGGGGKLGPAQAAAQRGAEDRRKTVRPW